VTGIDVDGEGNVIRRMDAVSAYPASKIRLTSEYGKGRMTTINVVRIDDGVRAKLVCSRCGGETYVPLLPEGTATSVSVIIQALSDACDGHGEMCV
jgi:hypothetical protein